MLAALLGCGGAAWIIGGPDLILYVVLIRMLAACWFVDSGDKILDGRNITGVIASAVIFIGGSYVADMALLGDLASPVANTPIHAVAMAANIILFFVLAFICDLLKPVSYTHLDVYKRQNTLQPEPMNSLLLGSDGLRTLLNMY